MARDSIKDGRNGSFRTRSNGRVADILMNSEEQK